ncbi:MAG: 3-oxoadipate enol-lactonase [Gammaproteobacteria bacterium]|jgi:3-oxoadipate enol-lactonase|nr:3-oxoadipate enol-lactonase [Gammaproteobacteria bacterium]
MPVARVSGVELYYRLDGDENAAQTIVFSNSLSSNLSMWDAQISAMVAAGYRTVRYDTRGHGQSSSPPGPYCIEQLVDDLCALLDHLALSRVHLCGLSMGGMVAQAMAVAQAERLNSVLLCSTAAYMNPPGVWDQRIAAVDEGGMGAVADGTIERWFTPQGIESLAEDVARIRDGIMGTSVAGYAACCAAIRDMDQREAIKQLSLPVLVVVGEQDPGTTVAHATDMHERIGGSSLVVIPQARHFVNVERATEFNRALLDFLGRTAA